MSTRRNGCSRLIVILPLTRSNDMPGPHARPVSHAGCLKIGEGQGTTCTPLR